mgnify:CR=1 FL=1
MVGSDADVAGIYDAFGQSVTFDLTPTDLTITAIFTDGTDAVNFGGIEVEATKPSLTCRSAQLTSQIVRGVSVTVGSDTYTVERLHRMGTGDTVLFLKT